MRTHIDRERRRRGRCGDPRSERLPAAPVPLPEHQPPDIVERLRTDAPLNEIDPATLYGGGKAGYTDHPTLTHA
ncbi:hypothetical protein OG446_35035 [Streptomyces sp. NBC_00236]